MCQALPGVKSGLLETSGDRERKNRFGECCSLGCHKHPRRLALTLIVREPKWGAGGIGELGEGGILGGRDFSSEPTVVPNVNGKTCGEGNVPAVG